MWKRKKERNKQKHESPRTKKDIILFKKKGICGVEKIIWKKTRCVFPAGTWTEFVPRNGGSLWLALVTSGFGREYRLIGVDHGSWVNKEEKRAVKTLIRIGCLDGDHLWVCAEKWDKIMVQLSGVIQGNEWLGNKNKKKMMGRLLGGPERKYWCLQQPENYCRETNRIRPCSCKERVSLCRWGGGWWVAWVVVWVIGRVIQATWPFSCKHIYSLLLNFMWL